MGLDATVKRLSPAIIAVMIAIIAYFQAAGLGRVLLLAVGDGEPARRAIPVKHRVAPPVDEDHATSADAILARNAFDSVTGPIARTAPKTPAASGDLEGAIGQDPYADPPCAGARALLIVSSADPTWSFAAVVGADGKTVLRRRGEELDGQKVWFVGDMRPEVHQHPDERGVWDRVWLTNGTSRCQLALGAKMVAGKPPPPKPQAANSSSLADRIRSVGPNSYEVDRATVDAIINNPAELMKTQAFPVKEGDRVVGLRLRGIRPGSVLGAIGIQNNDLLTAINGFEMNDPQKMIEAYTKLMKADRLTATVVRGGQLVNLDYAIK